MATYAELYALKTQDTSPTQQKIIVAILKKAQLLAADAQATPAQNAWAKAALESPEAYQRLAWNYILGQYSAYTAEQITGAIDADVQTAVDAVVNTLLGV